MRNSSTTDIPITTGLTLAQEDVYFEHLMNPESAVGNIGAKIEIAGRVDRAALNSAYIELIKQHNSYRSVVDTLGTVTYMGLDAEIPDMGFIDLESCESPIDAAEHYMDQEFCKPFSVTAGQRLYKFVLLRITENFHYLFSVYHHIITDGWGTSLMFSRLVANYDDIMLRGKVANPCIFDYKEYLAEDLRYRNSEAFYNDRSYWMERFRSLPENLFERITHNPKAHKSERFELIIERARYNELIALAKELNCTTFQLILGFLLSSLSIGHQQSDIVVGLPVLNRSNRNFRNTVGLFMSISPFRLDVNFKASFRELISQIRNQLRADYRHQRFPVGQLIKQLQLQTSKDKLYNVTFSYEKQDYSAHFLDTHTKVIPLTHKSENVALAVYLREFDELEDVKLDFDYNLNYFSSSSIVQLTTAFNGILETIVAEPHANLQDLQTVVNRQLIQGMAGSVAYKEILREGTSIDLFKEHVAICPNAAAVRDDEKSYSYHELDALSDQVAAFLIRNCEDRSPILLLLERSADMIVAILGVLKSGRPYIPLDPDFPVNRLQLIQANSGCRLLLTSKTMRPDLSLSCQNIYLESIFDSTDYDVVQKVTLREEDTAYIIYTSGSTGIPKGVEISHRSLYNLLVSMRHEPGMKAGDVLFAVTTYSFDISILEFFGPLISGGTVRIASRSILLNPSRLTAVLEAEKPEIVQGTPPFFQMLLDSGWTGSPGLKILCGGDAMSKSLAKRMLKVSDNLWNMYGPTETTIWSSIKKIERTDDANSIGRPIANTKILIFDSHYRLSPIGVAGEIYIGGSGVAKGYYNDQALSNSKFIEDPLGSGTVLFKTGDLGKWNSEGEICFLGRNDNQVKINGYRIDLEEIEAHLERIKGISRSVVIAKKSENSDFLVAFVIKMDAIGGEEICAQLRKNLPDYMIPSHIMEISEIPLTANLKIDRRQLQLAEFGQPVRSAAAIAPRSNLEKQLAVYWQAALGTDTEISANDNFFSLGGHSLQILKLVGMISADISGQFAFRDVFEYPTIGLQAAYLHTLRPFAVNIDLQVTEMKEFYPLTVPQANIWIASQDSQLSVAYNMYGAFVLSGKADVLQLREAISDVIGQNEVLRARFFEMEGIPYQKFMPAAEVVFDIQQHRIEGGSPEELLYSLAHTEFDLGEDLLLKVHLIQAQDAEFLLFCTHHIIMDGISLDTLIRMLKSKYGGEPRQPTVAAAPLQFNSYIARYNDGLAATTGVNSDFWKSYLKGYAFVPFMPLPSSSHRQSRGNRLMRTFPADLRESLASYALGCGVTPYSIFVTVVNLLLFRISGRTDIGIGIIDSGRRDIPLQQALGMFAKTLMIRTHLDDTQLLVDAVIAVQKNLFGILEHENLPYGEFRGPLFDVVLTYTRNENSTDEIMLSPSLKLTWLSVPSKYSRLPLVFSIIDDGGSLKLIMDYSTDVLSGSNATTIADNFLYMAEQIVSSDNLKICDIRFSGEEDQPADDFDFDFNFNF